MFPYWVSHFCFPKKKSIAPRIDKHDKVTNLFIHVKHIYTSTDTLINLVLQYTVSPNSELSIPRISPCPLHAWCASLARTRQRDTTRLKQQALFIYQLCCLAKQLWVLSMAHVHTLNHTYKHVSLGIFGRMDGWIRWWPRERWWWWSRRRRRCRSRRRSSRPSGSPSPSAATRGRTCTGCTRSGRRTSTSCGRRRRSSPKTRTCTHTRGHTLELFSWFHGRQDAKGDQIAVPAARAAGARDGAPALVVAPHGRRSGRLQRTKDLLPCTVVEYCRCRARIKSGLKRRHTSRSHVRWHAYRGPGNARMFWYVAYSEHASVNILINKEREREEQRAIDL